jgi:addiction module HigA family antidote
MAKATLSPGAAVKKQADQYNLTVSQLAEGIKVSQSAARLLLNNKLKISAALAQRISKYFGKTPEYWIKLQNAYELAELSGDSKNAAILRSISGAVKAAPKAKAKAPAKKAGRGRPAGSKKAAKAPAKRAAKKA